MKQIFTYILLFACCFGLMTCTPEFTMEDVQFVIALQSSDITQGEVFGSGRYRYKAEVTLRATAYEFYQFKEWSDGVKDNPRKVVVTKDMDLTASFEKYNPISGKEGDYEYVDLGLPSGTLWAACNVGAKTPEDLGGLYAWGETSPKTKYDWTTYKHGTDYYELTKYCYKYQWSWSQQEYADGKTVLELEDDAATVNWGGRWCMPTAAEIDELISNCNFTWTDNYQNTGVAGYKVSSKKPGNKNYIFFPEEADYYWSSSLSLEEPRYAYYFYLDDFVGVEKGRDNYTRSYSCYVRPVIAKTYTITATANDASMGSVAGGGTYGVNREATLIATAAKGYHFVRWSDGSTLNTRTISVTGNLHFTAYFEANLSGNGYDYIDLGLPSGTLWATCNVGAESPEDYGDYFAWGEIEPKATYEWSNYKHCNGSEYRLTKYCYESSYGYNGFTDNQWILDSDDDAATANMGNAWCMPTETEINELITSCSVVWTTQNGVNGYRIVGPNGSSIFLPAAGFYSGSEFGRVGEDVYYWSASLSDYRSNLSRFLCDDGVFALEITNFDRNYGLPVRSIYIKTYTITGISADANLGTVTGSGTYNSRNPAVLEAVPADGCYFVKWNDGNTDNPRTIAATQDMTFTAYFEGHDFNGHGYVDLDLPSGTMWATCNVGANSPEGYGDYFAWGETSSKSDYNWSTYKHCQGTATSLIKYCNNSRWGYNGFTDDKIVLDSEDDAATVHWGGDWRMPTQAELQELCTECSWEWTDNYNSTGIAGNIVKSKKDATRYIFLPCASYYDDLGFASYGEWGAYWSSSLYEKDADSAYGLSLDSNGYQRTNLELRTNGLPVRPVCSY